VLFDHVSVEYASRHGLYLQNADVEIMESVFRNNANENISSGVYVAGGEATITDSIFEDNTYGLFLSGSTSTVVRSNTFRRNSADPIYVSGGAGTFSGNDGEENGRNAIVISGEVTTPDHTTILSSNPLSYFLADDAHVVANSTLIFEKGVVVKSHDRINNRGGALVVDQGGRLISEGNVSADLIFTSQYDDTVGSLIYGGTQSLDSGEIISPAAGDWVGIEVRDGGEVSLKGFTMRYAGEKMRRSTGNGAFKLEGGFATSTIANAFFEHNFLHGIWMYGNSNALVKDSTFLRHSKETGDAIAIRVDEEGNLQLENVSFDANDTDVAVFGYTARAIADEETKSGVPITIPAGLFE